MKNGMLKRQAGTSMYVKANFVGTSIDVDRVVHIEDNTVAI